MTQSVSPVENPTGSDAPEKGDGTETGAVYTVEAKSASRIGTSNGRGGESGSKAEARFVQESYMDETFKKVEKQSADAIELKRSLQRYGPSNGFFWPDDRAETEESILELKSKQVLIVRGVASDWINFAALRIATVLQASLLRLWPECDGVYRLKNEEKLAFGFWRNFERQDKPVIILVPKNSAAEFLRNFITADWEKWQYDFREALHAANVFLLLLLPDDDDYDNQLKTGWQQLKKVCASWCVNTIKLELRKRRGSSGDALLTRIKNECGLSDLADRHVYRIIVEEEKADDDTILSIIRNEVRENNAEMELIKQALDEPTELKLRLVYCAAYFNDMGFADFIKMASVLLKDQYEEIHDKNGALTEKRSLEEVLFAPLRLARVMKECNITSKTIGKIACVGFTRHIRYETVRQILFSDHFLFFPLTKELIEQDVLFAENLSDKLLSTVARVIRLVIESNYTTYDGVWLAHKAFQQLDKLYEGTSAHERNLIELGETYLGISLAERCLEPIEYLLKELLLSNKDELIQIVKIFFRELMASRLKKKISLGLALDLYRELRDEGNFPEEELDLYFKRSLEEENAANKFDVYQMLVRMQYYKDLYKKTAAWLNDENKERYHWTKCFSSLYRLDYFALTFHVYFSAKDDENEQEYELLAYDSVNGFSEELRVLLTDLSSDENLQRWKELTELYENLFSYKCYLLEKTVTGAELSKGREAPENSDVLTLAADIVETWFYILSSHRIQRGEKNADDKMKAFARLLVENTEKKKLQELRNYWRRKSRQLYPATIVSFPAKADRTENEKTQLKQTLNQRLTSAELLIGLTVTE